LFDAEDILGGIIGGALGGGRRKSWRRARRALDGSGLINAQTLIAAAGVAWGLYETWQGQQQGGGGPAVAPAPGAPPTGSAGAPVSAGSPASSSAHGGSTDAGPAAAAPDEDGVPAPIARLIRIMISAARADGELGPAERERILAEAREVGAEALVRKELDAPRPLGELVAGVSDPELKEQIYTLAFVIVRADEAVAGGERIYLVQLANRLGLDQAAVARLEGLAERRIEAASESGPTA
jgi:uncharacterized membrane protein YebE (DUF533 family)